jgi:hypothetical protein
MFNSNEKIYIKIDDKIKDTIKKEDTNEKKDDKIKPIFVCNAKCNECLSKKCYFI